MSITKKIKQYVSRHMPGSLRNMQAAKGYDLWAASYDAQPNNLMLKLDEKLVNGFLDGIQLENKVIADIGCGTGRHWQKLFSGRPAGLVGYDVSTGMLAKLKEKYPRANVFEIKDDTLPGLADSSCDLVISTLTVAHIDRLETAIREWSRVLRTGGEMIITDYHPDLLAKGGDRSFIHKEKYVSIRNNVHSIEYLNKLFELNKLEALQFEEFFIDDSVKQYYEQQGMLHVYEKSKGMPVIYGFHLKKANAAPKLT